MTKNDIIMFSTTVCTVLFGTDESITKIDFGNGFKAKRMSLIPSKDHLDKIFEVDEMGLRRNYETARIDDDTLDVICIYKRYDAPIIRSKVDDEFENICNEALAYLDNKIRTIRLIQECSLRFKYLAVKMNSESEKHGETDMSMSFNAIIPVGEAMVTKTILKFHHNLGFEEEIFDISFPLSNTHLNDCHRYYDLSYHQENFIAITLLITCLEMLFLKSESAKKERLAKRCAAYIYEEKASRVSSYKALLREYKKRSDFVHDGKQNLIGNDDIIVLRDYVRKSLIKMISDIKSKDEILRELIQEIKTLDYWDGDGDEA